LDLFTKICRDAQLTKHEKKYIFSCQLLLMRLLRLYHVDVLLFYF